MGPRRQNQANGDSVGEGRSRVPGKKKKNQIMRFVQQWRGKVELVGAVVPAQCTKVCKLFQKESARSLEN